MIVIKTIAKAIVKKMAIPNDDVNPVGFAKHATAKIQKNITNIMINLLYPEIVFSKFKVLVFELLFVLLFELSIVLIYTIHTIIFYIFSIAVFSP
jgi:hypothetical protein